VTKQERIQLYNEIIAVAEQGREEGVAELRIIPSAYPAEPMLFVLSRLDLASGEFEELARVTAATYEDGFTHIRQQLYPR
jgi:hypothetical protein